MKLELTEQEFEYLAYLINIGARDILNEGPTRYERQALKVTIEILDKLKAQKISAQ
jgi:hypothetical protein